VSTNFTRAAIYMAYANKAQHYIPKYPQSAYFLMAPGRDHFPAYCSKPRQFCYPRYISEEARSGQKNSYFANFMLNSAVIWQKTTKNRLCFIWIKSLPKYRPLISLHLN
jgi:hypothetical protein